MKILVPVKRVLDANIKAQVKSDGSGMVDPRSFTDVTPVTGATGRAG